MKKWLFTLIPSLGYSVSVILFNDSPFTLNAQILSADGQELTTVQIAPRHQLKWQDSDQNVQSFTETPFTVIWYCKDGQEYGVNSQIATGAYVPAQSSQGRRYCRPDKKKES